MKNNNKTAIHISGPINTENWAEQINDLACQSAHDLLREIGPEKAIELAFATLQNYYLHTYAAALPHLQDKTGTAAIRLQAITAILDDIGLQLESTIITQRITPDHP